MEWDWRGTARSRIPWICTWGVDAVTGVSPSKCGVAVQYFEELSNVAVELRTKGQEGKELGEREREKKRFLCCCLHSESKHDAREFNSIVPLCCCASQNTWPSLHCPASTSSHFPQTILFTEMREIYNIVTSCSKRWNENGYSDWRLLEFSSVSPEKRFHGNLKWIQWIPSSSLPLYAVFLLFSTCYLKKWHSYLGQDIPCCLEIKMFIIALTKPFHRIISAATPTHYPSLSLYLKSQSAL